MSDGNKLLETYIKRYPFIDSIILTDNEGISICFATNGDEKNKEFIEK